MEFRSRSADLSQEMWNGKTVTVIFPTYNEKDSIRAAIMEYFGTGLADEILVVNNNASRGTSEEIMGTGAREIFESSQGYGYALLRGIDGCSADLIVLSEPDGTFLGRDLLKLLTYSDDVPVVFGTRTSREFIWAGANMGRFLRWGNWAVAKMTELLFNTTILTDMGCTYRLFHREALQRIRPHLTIGGSHFGPQLLMEVIAHQIPFIEIPLNYRPRIGESSVTGDLWKATVLGLQMITLVLAYRFGLHSARRAQWDRSRNLPDTAPFAQPGLKALSEHLGRPEEATRLSDVSSQQHAVAGRNSTPLPSESAPTR